MVMRPVRRCQPRDELVRDRLVHDQAAQASCSAGRPCRRPRTATPRTARSRSALGATITALLPPSSRSDRPSRGRRPRRDAPFPSGNFRWPRSAGGAGSRRACARRRRRPPTTERRRRPRGRSPKPLGATMCETAIAVSGVSGDGFQTTVSPQTGAIAAFHAQTATGKLNAVMMPTGPSGCHCSIIRCRAARWRSSGRKAAATGRRRSRTCRSSPAPRPALPARILPVSRVTSTPRSPSRSRSTSPSGAPPRRRRGAGASRQAPKARLTVRATAASASAASVPGDASDVLAGDRGADNQIALAHAGGIDAETVEQEAGSQARFDGRHEPEPRPTGARARASRGRRTRAAHSTR